MNSSHNPQLIPWQFEEYIPESRNLSESALEEILGALTSSQQTTKNRYSRAGQCLIKHQDASSVSSWLPQDINQIPDAQLRPLSTRPNSSESRPMSARSTATNSNPLNKAQQEAQQILAQARLEAETLLNQAQQEVDLFLAEASDQVAAARQEGYLEGKQAAEAEMSSMLAIVRDLVEETRDWQDALLRQSEPIIVGLIKTISTKLFGEGFALDQNILQQTLSRAVEKARTLGELQIYMNPADAAGLDPYWREFQASMIGSPIKIIASESILRGGCYINGKSGSVDMRIETQLNTVLEALNMR